MVRVGKSEADGKLVHLANSDLRVCGLEVGEQVHKRLVRVVEDNLAGVRVKPYGARTCEQVKEYVRIVQQRLNLRHKTTLIAFIGDWPLVH